MNPITDIMYRPKGTFFSHKIAGGAAFKCIKANFKSRLTGLTELFISKHAA